MMAQSEPELTSLEEVLYQFGKLYERFLLAVQNVEKREAEMKKNVTAFHQKMDSLDELRNGVKKSIQETTSKAAVMVAELIGTETRKQMEHVINRLQNSVYEAESMADHYKKVQRVDFTKTLSIAVLVGALIGFVIGTIYF